MIKQLSNGHTNITEASVWCESSPAWPWRGAFYLRSGSRKRFHLYQLHGASIHSSKSIEKQHELSRSAYDSSSQLVTFFKISSVIDFVEMSSKCRIERLRFSLYHDFLCTRSIVDSQSLPTLPGRKWLTARISHGSIPSRTRTRSSTTLVSGWGSPILDGSKKNQPIGLVSRCQLEREAWECKDFSWRDQVSSSLSLSLSNWIDPPSGTPQP